MRNVLLCLQNNHYKWRSGSECDRLQRYLVKNNAMQAEWTVSLERDNCSITMRHFYGLVILLKKRSSLMQDAVIFDNEIIYLNYYIE